MANVTRLPDSLEVQWRAYESELRAVLQPDGRIAPAVEYAIAKFKPIFMEGRSCPFNTIFLSGKPGDLVADITHWVQYQSSILIVEVMRRDVELFHLRGPA